MINLFNSYNQESIYLHESLKKAGYDYPTVVIDDNGFLPEDVYSPYGYFLGKEKEGNARYFNQIESPKYWEIKADNNMGGIFNYNKKKANIFYTEPKNKRIVRTVEWLGENGKIRSIDYYNKYGRKYAHTIFDVEQNPKITTYFNIENKETIVESHVTGDIILSEGNKIKIFKNKEEFIIHYLHIMKFDIRNIIYNHLGLPLFITERLEEGEDYLFWQEPVGDDIPGNMKLLLENANRDTKIVVQNKEIFDKIKRLTNGNEKVKLLGYIYEYKRKNKMRKNALIVTNTDQVENIIELIESHEDIVFNIAAITEMSEVLLSLSKYKNVRLYPNVKEEVMEKLWAECDLYLDINHSNEILNATRRAFENNMLLLAFTNTRHTNVYISDENTYNPENWKELSEKINLVYSNKEEMEKAIFSQKKSANEVTPVEYEKILGTDKRTK